MQRICDTKFLGVNIDGKLQWGCRVEQVKAKVLQGLGPIKHAKNFFLQVTCRKCIEELLSSILAIVARSVAAVENPNLTLSKRSKIELQE